MEVGNTRAKDLCVPILLFLMFSIAVPVVSVQAQIETPYKEVVKEPYYEEFDDYIGKGMMQGILFVKSYEGDGLYKVTIQVLFRFRVYDEDENVVAIVRSRMTYTGTGYIAKPIDPYTGRFVASWVFVTKVDIDLPFEPHGHYVAMYKDGDIVKELGMEPPF